jgi:cytochrome c-type biogenesis protein CcsB
VRTLIHRLASITIAVGLLVIILVALAAGTIVESLRGSEAAVAAVYGAAWFRGLLGLLAANLALSLVDRWPWGRQRIGFVLTHAAVLFVFAGALLTAARKVEGRLALWEGEESGTFAAATAPGSREEGRPLDLPFRVRLDAFEIDYYQGTRRPAMFRSRVTVSDPGAGKTFAAKIEMNHELSYAGYRLFQSSYQQTPEGDRTILTVSRDPGQPVVFVGYGLLLLGMATVFATRIAERRAAGRRLAEARARPVRRAAAALFALALLGGGAREAVASAPADETTIEALRRLPVQHDGRVMPLDTQAREAAWRVTGRWRFDGADPVALVLAWTSDPARWAAEPMVLVGDRGLVAAIGLPAGARRASFLDLARNPRLMHLLEQARDLAERDTPLPPLLRKARDLEERLVILQGYLNGVALRAVPDPADPTAAWLPPVHLQGPAGLLALLDEGRAARYADTATLATEIAYNRLRPSRLSWWILAAAAAASLAAWVRGLRPFDVLAVVGLVAGFAVMTWGIAARWQIAGRIPASNMYESLLFLGWGIGLFALVALLALRNRLVLFNAAAMSALTMALADLLPIDPFIHPVPPVLAGTVWLAIHVPIIMLSYSVLALGVLVAHMQIGVSIVAPARHDLAFRLNDLLYWYIHAGSILLLAGILTGSYWAASSWGRYWGWDPKEVWSLIAFLAYAAILHGRFDRLVGPFGVAVLSIAAFWTILMTYLGVNFVLTAGLHSYGFGGSGVVRWMLIIAVLEGLFLVTAWLSRTSGPRAGKVRPSPA